jgi:hypothetical protein
MGSTADLRAPRAPALPAATVDLTPAWLTGALRRAGTLCDARVVAVASEQVGEGAGFVGTLARLRLRYDTTEPGAPPTVVAKLPTHLRANRALAELGGGYEREIRFYRELAQALPVRTPVCFVAERDPGGGGRPRLARVLVGCLDRCPSRLRRWLIDRGGRLAVARGRRYVLLLEDLGAAVAGDQIAGCEPGQARAALRALAALHASHWQRSALRELGWCAAFHAAPRTLHMYFRDALPRVRAMDAIADSPRAVALLAWLARHGVAFERGLRHLPDTLIHGDFRLDNLFFSSRGEDAVVTLCDWQTVAVGPAVFDLAYFLASSLRPEETVEVECTLVGGYHAALCASGVHGYALERCLADYTRALVAVLHRVVAGTQLVELGDGRGRALLYGLVAGCVRRLDSAPPERLSAALGADFGGVPAHSSPRPSLSSGSPERREAPSTFGGGGAATAASPSSRSRLR